ncbi:MAG: hypothetical protein KY445_07855, partial [Armatimonadetes bacterium]|nr:hypothetical protein [Armatimonadota bacterium]
AGNSAFKSTIRDALQGASDFSGRGATLTGDFAKSLREKADKWPEILGKLDEIAKSNDKIAVSTGETQMQLLEKQLAAQAALIAGMPDWIKDMFARTSAYIANDNALNVLRAG